MTTVTIRRDNGMVEIKAEGHATPRNDVCNAVTTLMYSIAAWAENYTRGALHSFEAGDAWITFSASPEADTICDFAELAFAQLEKNFPDSVRLKKKNAKIFSIFGAR